MTKSEFKNTPIKYTDVGIELGKHVLMYRNEKEHIQCAIREICKRVNPKSVIEIGFGLGYTADEFQKTNLDKHIIVEAHPEIAQKAQEWAKNNSNVTIMFDFFQNLRYPPRVDIIYDDRYDLVFNKVLPIFNLKAKYYARFSTTIIKKDERENRDDGFQYQHNNTWYFQYLRELNGD